MAIANVALTNTFDQWRIVTNQMVTLLNDIDSSANLVRAQSNTTPLVVTSSVSRGGTFYFDLSTNSTFTNTSTNVIATSNAVNKLYIAATDIGISSNVYANSVGSAGNVYADTVVTSNLAAGQLYTDGVVVANLEIANAYSRVFSNSVGASANAHALTAAGAGSDRSNAYSRVFANSVGASANAYALSVGGGGSDSANGYTRLYANTVGTSSNTYTDVVMTSNLASSKAYTDTVVSSNAASVRSYADSVGAAGNTVSSGTLTDTSSINWNISQYQIATVTLGGNRSMATPTGLKVGSFILHVYQDVTGGRNLTFSSDFKWPGGVAPTTTTVSGAHDMYSFICDGVSLYGSFLPDVK